MVPELFKQSHENDWVLWQLKYVITIVWWMKLHQQTELGATHRPCWYPCVDWYPCGNLWTGNRYQRASMATDDISQQRDTKYPKLLGRWLGFPTKMAFFLCVPPWFPGKLSPTCWIEATKIVILQTTMGILQPTRSTFCFFCIISNHRILVFSSWFPTSGHIKTWFLSSCITASYLYMK